MSEIQTGFQFIELTWEKGISWDVLWIGTPTPEHRIGEATFLGEFASRALADTFVNALRLQGFDGTVDYGADQELGRHDPAWAPNVDDAHIMPYQESE